MCVLLLLACTKMEQYFPNGKTTTIDGEEYLVHEISPGTYQALPNDPDLSWMVAYDAGIWAKNVRAIEAVTGCKVAPGSTRNQDNNTVAAVNC
ncbi:hypothetical protein [Tabrizicola fusiformis]|uniref:hypothetical protein n=1 Tax=Tabrizicola sp. SY72 TaxID=2741673 RepID=UPI0015743BC9|nr:hypothetical protein [Tabrizicola sp. SY72]NTT88226.1 hypothetical protein [Tabrizicola sp. SY72]